MGIGRDGRIGVVVRCRNSKVERRDEDDDSGMEYERVEFHMVEVNTERDTHTLSLPLHRDVLPPLLSQPGTANGVMLSLGIGSSSISVFGGLNLGPDDEFLVSLKPPPERRHLYYQGFATISLKDEDGDREWKPLLLPFDPHNACLPFCAVLGGKLYSFGCKFDPSLGYWKRLRVPSHVSASVYGASVFDSEPSYPVVADPSNNRILIHFHKHSDLYAFYPDPDPDPGRWELLKPYSCFPWAPMVAVTDDLLFLYEFNTLLVYDLASRGGGGGDPLDVVWSSSMCGNVMVTCVEFTSLFSLGNGLMCFTFDFALPPPDSTSTIHLFVFKPFRTAPPSTSIILTPISFHSKTIQSTHQVFDFLPLSQEAYEILVGKLA